MCAFLLVNADWRVGAQLSRCPAAVHVAKAVLCRSSSRRLGITALSVVSHSEGVVVSALGFFFLQFLGYAHPCATGHLLCSPGMPGQVLAVVLEPSVASLVGEQVAHRL